MYRHAKAPLIIRGHFHSDASGFLKHPFDAADDALLHEPIAAKSDHGRDEYGKHPRREEQFHVSTHKAPRGVGKFFFHATLERFSPQVGAIISRK